MVDRSEIARQFYREIAAWYSWAQQQAADRQIRLPAHCATEQQQALYLIRLLTRVLFCWFLVAKQLIPAELFQPDWLRATLHDFHPSPDPQRPDTASTFYHAILQNLCFGMLNLPPEERRFCAEEEAGPRYGGSLGDAGTWRYATAFRDTGAWLAAAARVPFLNGQLFDSLDSPVGDQHESAIRNGCSDDPQLGCHLPNDLFFGPERTIGLLRATGTTSERTARSKRIKVRGLIEILAHYPFMAEEDASDRAQPALDPELLGTVFENLLATHTEDTRSSARKASGTFYTPRAIVAYMVDEALKSYLAGQVLGCGTALEELFSPQPTLSNIPADRRTALIAAIGRVRILDPACGSGAFLLGALQRLVELLQKLEPCHESYDSGDHGRNYARKQHVIERALAGIDIQQIATQIAKLRIWISLLADQPADPAAPNLGLRPLPDLNTQLVVADAIGPLAQEQAEWLNQTQLTGSTLAAGGFDIILCNPPYRKERDSKPLLDTVAATSWGAAYRQGKMDYWFYFLHRALDLVRPGGIIGFITSRYWIESAGASKLLQRLAADVSPLLFVDIGKLQVFDNVAGHHLIHMYQRTDESLTVQVKRLDGDLSGLTATQSGPRVEIFHRAAQDLWEQPGRISLYPSTLKLPTEHTLGDLFRVSQGVVQNPDKVNHKNAERFGLRVGDGVFVLTSEELDRLGPTAAEQTFIKPFYDEADLQRFYVGPPSAYLLYLTKHNCRVIESLPNLHRHLSRYRPIMEARRETRNGAIAWFHLHWPRVPALFDGAHLVVPSMFAAPTAVLFTTTAYVGLGSNVVVARRAAADLGVLECLLNSSVAAWWWRQHAKQRGGGYDVGVARLRGFPLPSAWPAEGQVAALRGLANAMAVLQAHARSTDAARSAQDAVWREYAERLLNGLVYELYFPDELHGAGLRFFEWVERADWPHPESVPAANRVNSLRAKLQELHDEQQGLRQGLARLQTIEAVRTIEATTRS